jgi:hypothetical protein
MKRPVPCLFAAVLCAVVVSAVAVTGAACGGLAGGAGSTISEPGDAPATGAGDAGSTDPAVATSLSAALRLDSPEVASGTVLAIVVVFRNGGDTPAKLPVDPYYTINVSLDGVPIADAIGNAVIPADIRALPPGEERAYRITGIRTDVFGPGVYALEGGIGGLKLARVTVTAK